MNTLSANYLLLLLFSVFGVTSISAQNKEGKDKLITIEQHGDSLVCSEKEIYFEQLNFQFDSCDFYNNKLHVNFQLQNNTKETLILYPNYISWYDSSYLRHSGGNPLILKSGEAGTVKLETIPYHKRKMISYGELKINYGDEKELIVPMRYKFESSGVKPCKKFEGVNEPRSE